MALEKKGEQYISVKATAYSAGDDTDLVYKHSDFSLDLVPVHLSALLEQTSEMRTIESHIRHLVEKGWSETDTDTLKRELRHLSKRGYLVSKTNIIEGIKKRGSKEKENLE